MRLKTFTAATTAEAMRQVRSELGLDAIIVSTRQPANGEGARIVAAVEEAGDDIAPRPTSAPIPFAPAAPRVIDVVRRALVGHGAPAPMVDMLAGAAAAFSTADPVLALAGALDGALAFEPLPALRQAGSAVLIGPAGAGKTVTAAKLAHRAFAAGHSVGVVTADGVRAGGVAQLEAFTRILGLDLEAAPTPEKLAAAVARLGHRDVLIVDTPQVNPFDRAETEALARLIAAANARPVLVLPAAGDVAETVDQAAVFRALGARAVLFTRLDATRRLGAMLAVARETTLALAGVGDSPHVVSGLSAINPVSLARRLMPRNARAAAPGDDPAGAPPRRAGAAS